MATPRKPSMDSRAVAAFLAAHLGDPIADVQPLDGGNFSRAFAFRWRDGAYVLRLNTGREGFDKDRFLVMRSCGAEYPFPASSKSGT